MTELSEALLTPAAAKPGAPMRSVIFNVVNCTFGTGFFLYPRQIARNGFAVTLVILTTVMALAAFSLHALNVAMTLSPTRLTAYPETIAHFTHPRLAQVVSLTITYYLTGAGAAYLALVGDQLSILLGDQVRHQEMRMRGPLLRHADHGCPILATNSILPIRS